MGKQIPSDTTNHMQKDGFPKVQKSERSHDNNRVGGTEANKQQLLDQERSRVVAVSKNRDKEIYINAKTRIIL